MPGNARLRAYLIAAGAAAFLVSVGPAVPAVAAATPTASAPTDATPTTNPPVVIAPTATTVPGIVPSVATPTPTVVTLATRAPTPVRTTTAADLVIAIARSMLGRPWVYGAAGPSVFDCAGLVIFSFREAGIARIIGSSHEVSAFALYARFRELGLASRTNGQRGDLVIWGGGTHVGIYLGNGMAISTLVGGVRIHPVRALTTPFTTFLHTGIADVAAADVNGTTTARTMAARPAIVMSHRVTTTTLRLRSGPSMASRVFATLGPRTKLGVIRVAKDQAGRTWFRVLVGGRLGWLAGWYTRSAT